ncbi:MAG: HAMP domain-containing sensor histidine kinase [Polyangiaceae bacterium]
MKASSDASRSDRTTKLLYFGLVPAIVVAVLMLGGFALKTTLRIEKARQQSVLDATWTLASERVNGLENQIIAQDNVVATHADVSNLASLNKKWLATAARETPTVRAILVLDLNYPTHDVLAFVSKVPGPGDDAFRRLLLARLLKTMILDASTDELHHVHEVIDGEQYLLGYWQRDYQDRRFLVVAWHDVDRIVSETMPQLFRDPGRGNARMNVVDEGGRIVFGPPIKVGELGVSLPFLSTLSNWRLQLALASADELSQEVERKRIIELSMVVIAGIVAVFGLFVVINATINERRLASLKSEFVANVSHELKTPLSLIRMFGELLLLDRVRDADKRVEYYRIIVTESERLTALIENVLDFARVERGKAAYDFVESDLGAVVKRAIEVYRYRAEKEGVVIEVRVADDLPLIDADPRAIELSVMNLLDNALKYAKGAPVRVNVSATEKDIVIAVADEGPGIPAAEQERVFERFYRGRSASGSSARGSGIGLALVRHIARSHGGDIVVKSPTLEGGTGTTFSLVIPKRHSGRAPSSSPG